MRPQHIFGAIAIGASFYGGYLTHKLASSPTEHRGDETLMSVGYNVRDNLLTYSDSSRTIQREIRQRGDTILVGTLRERITDLLYEDPAVVKKTTEDILNDL